MNGQKNLKKPLAPRGVSPYPSAMAQVLSGQPPACLQPMATSEDTPPDLYDPTTVSTDTDRVALIQHISRTSTGWFVAQVRPRYEKQVARWCMAKGIPYFLPYTITPSHSLVPLFSGFMFAASPLPEGHVYTDIRPYSTTNLFPKLFADYELRRHQHCFGILRTQLQEQLKHQLAAIAASSPHDNCCSPQRLPTGTLVKVTRGPFAGLEGTITNEKGKLWIEVVTLGRVVPVNIDPDDLAPIGGIRNAC